MSPIISRCNVAAVLKSGVEAMAEWAEFAEENPTNPEVVRRKAEAKVHDEAFKKRLAYLDACLANGTSPARGGESRG